MTSEVEQSSMINRRLAVGVTLLAAVLVLLVGSVAAVASGTRSDAPATRAMQQAIAVLPEQGTVAPPAIPAEVALPAPGGEACRRARCGISSRYRSEYTTVGSWC